VLLGENVRGVGALLLLPGCGDREGHLRHSQLKQLVASFSTVKHYGLGRFSFWSPEELLWPLGASGCLLGASWVSPGPPGAVMSKK